MDRMQIGMKLAMDVLGIPVCVSNYRKICDAVYLCEQEGVYISPAGVEFDFEKGVAYSPRSPKLFGGGKNLLDDVYEIASELETGVDDSAGWQLDNDSLKKLGRLREILKP